MRIIAGRFKGRKLVEAKNYNFRPTTYRNREALFSVLLSNAELAKYNFNLNNSSVLDLCCGSGSVGIEAISRGVRDVVFIDINKSHLELLKKNINNFAINDKTESFCLDAKKLPKFLNKYKFDLIFIDPPYQENYQEIFNSLSKLDIFANDCLVVVEYDKNMPDDFYDKSKFELIFLKSYSKSSFAFLKYVIPNPM